MKVEIMFVDTMSTDYYNEFVFGDTEYGISKSYTVEEFKRNIFTILKERKQSLLDEISASKRDSKYAFLKIWDMLSPWADSYFNEEEFEVICPDSLEGTELEFFKPTEDYSYLYDRKELLQKIISSIED